MVPVSMAGISVLEALIIAYWGASLGGSVLRCRKPSCDEK